MKKWALTSLLLLAACGDRSKATQDALSGAAEGDDRIACAVDGAAEWERSCAIERVSGPDGTSLTLRHPGGGFRRLLVATDGRGVVAADGAAPAVVSLASDNRIQVAVAGDRYLLPATIKNRR